MGRKVFISMLGTGFYAKCKYAHDNFCSRETRFIQIATIERLVNTDTWGENDHMFFLLTDKARKDNWDNPKTGVRKNFRTQMDEPYVGLKEELSNLHLKNKIKEVDIPEGKNEEEMWEIFNTLFALVNEDDELYIDITHSFRYLPMMLLVFCNYAKFLKNTSTRYISYGNWENVDPSTHIAPFVDLLSLSALQDWSYAAANYLDNGNTKQLVNLSKKALTPILREAKGTNADASALNKFITCLQTVGDDMRTCRGINLINATNITKMKMEAEKITQPFITPFVPVFKKIQEGFMTFDTTPNPINGLLAAEWCLDNELYQQAITILQENCVTYFCIKEQLNWTLESDRYIVSQTFNIKNNPKVLQDEEKWILAKKDDGVPHPESLKKIVYRLLNDHEFEAMAKVYSDISNARNDLNHSGIRNNPIPADRLRRKISDSVAKARQFYQSMPCQMPHKPSLFINLSNHPIATWSEKQLEAAKSYGKIEEMRFPNIDSNADNAAIKDIATDYVEKILELNKQYNVTVHVMGEMVFTYLIVNMLKEQGIRCIASTSERCVTERMDGVKENIFNFTRFRDY